jgi:hypothetical protein
MVLKRKRELLNKSVAEKEREEVNEIRITKKK